MLHGRYLSLFFACRKEHGTKPGNNADGKVFWVPTGRYGSAPATVPLSLARRACVLSVGSTALHQGSSHAARDRAVSLSCHVPQKTANFGNQESAESA